MKLHPMSFATQEEYDAAVEAVMETGKRNAMKAATDWLEVHFGDRCPEPSDNCECCRRWRLFDELFAEVDA